MCGFTSHRSRTPAPPRVSSAVIGAGDGAKPIDRVSRPRSSSMRIVWWVRTVDIVRNCTSPVTESVCVPRAENPDRSQATDADGRVPDVSTPENQFCCHPSGRRTAAPEPAGVICVS